ncbi:MAG: hypothetical protein IJZ93_03095 [Clostridia bacterium]|nr:hypothetical protein [Clostridia bacterium]
MIYIVYCIIVIAAVALFGFNTDGISFRNIPLLVSIISVILLLLIIRFIKYVCVFAKAKSKLKKSGYSVVKCNILPPVFRKNKGSHIVASKDGCTVNIFVMIVKRAYLRYHFEDINTLELYKSTRMAIKPRFRQANIVSEHVETKKVGTKKLYWDDNDTLSTRVVMFNKLPSAITHSISSQALCHGDKICGKIILYNLERL